MQTKVNSAVLATMEMDSAALGPLAMVAHQVNDPGSYLGTVYLGDEPVGQFQLEAEEGGDRMQADLDLARYARTGSVAERRIIRLKVRAGGFLLAFVSQGRGGYRVTLERAEDRKDADAPAKPVFDSAALSEGDIFAVTLIRPGEWSAEAGKEASGRITVAYPKTGKTPYRPREQGNALALEGGRLSPDHVKMGPGEGVVFRIGKDANPRIRVALVEPDDGPGEEARDGRTQRPAEKSKGERRVLRRARWDNPRYRK